MKFSVLICTYNRPEMLAQCLDALAHRTTEKPDEIVVVNGGDARTDEVVEGFRRQGTGDRRQETGDGSRNAGNVEVQLVKTVNQNLAASRNAGLPHCTGDIIGMTDDDAEVFPDWVTQMKRAHAEHPEAGAVGGTIVGARADSFMSRLADRVTFAAYPTARYVRTLPGVNVSYKRAGVERAGPQDETLFRGEDVDYNWRLRQLGYEIYYDPAVQVRHHHRPTLRKFLNQHYMYGRAYYLVRRKWQDMYCVYPHSVRSVKDVLKAVNFAAAIFYEPLMYAGRMERPADKILAYPVLVANQMAWRGGMIRQKLATR